MGIACEGEVWEGMKGGMKGWMRLLQRPRLQLLLRLLRLCGWWDGSEVGRLRRGRRWKAGAEVQGGN